MLVGSVDPCATYVRSLLIRHPTFWTPSGFGKEMITSLLTVQPILQRAEVVTPWTSEFLNFADLEHEGVFSWRLRLNRTHPIWEITHNTFQACSVPEPL